MLISVELCALSSLRLSTEYVVMSLDHFCMNVVSCLADHVLDWCLPGKALYFSLCNRELVLKPKHHPAFAISIMQAAQQGGPF